MHLQPGNARGPVRLNAITDESLVTDQLGGRQEVVRNERFGFLAPTGKIQLLDLGGLIFVAISTEDVVVEVLALGPHAPYIKGGDTALLITQTLCGVLITDGKRATRNHLEGSE